MSRTSHSPSGPSAPAISTAPATSGAPSAPKSRKATSERKAATSKKEPAPKKAPIIRTPAPPTPVLGPDEEIAVLGLDSPRLFLNRELTWLNFNWRVLHEAEDARNPLLERVKFLSIVGSNLDEFFMKRIGGLKQQVGAGVHRRTPDGRTPAEQIAHCYQVIRPMEARAQQLWHSLIQALAKERILVKPYARLSRKQQKALRETYIAEIFPLVTPQAMDPAHPFPFVSNLSLNLLVTLHHPGEQQQLLARVKVPVGAGIPRYLQAEGGIFVLLEEVMAHNLDLLFPGMEVDSCEMFRVTRNANTELDEEKADDLLAMIETELRERKFAPIVRLEVAPGITPLHRGMLAAELGLDEESDVFEVDGMLGMRDLMELWKLDRPELHDPAHHPIDHPELTPGRNIFHVIRDAGSILLQHPYESFRTSVERFLLEAAEDPKVRAIKMTLYRTSAESRIINALIMAAKNGKQVAVAVELKARFDEEANIRWAARLEEAGIHVTYGVVGLKTHCKVVLVVRQDYNGLRRYAHFGTGNYHAVTARIYSDLGLLTCDDAIGQDLTELFNYLTTGYKPKRHYKKILPAPKVLKGALLDKIQREIDIHRKERPGLIQLKMNALEDVDITRALYRAAKAGVRVDLIVRDTCRLIPGIEGLSENVRVISIVGRFLEHTRIFYFRNNGREEYFIGSADCMKRNLESRVESVVPVEDPRHQQTLRRFLDIQLADRRSAWEMQPDGSYVQLTPEDGGEAVSSQAFFIEWAEKRRKESTRLRKRRVRGVGRRNLKA
ncbi:MAG: polyphosphate kinase 1 [Acidobacteriota bacterium]|nr:polyphosphate kinase 1 [Acidobacteriota bacterium]